MTDTKFCYLGACKPCCVKRLLEADGGIIDARFFASLSSIAPIVLSIIPRSCTLLAKKAELSMFSSAHSKSSSKSTSFICIKLFYVKSNLGVVSARNLALWSS